MNYGEIKLCDIANGEGVRVSLFVSGCTHHCKNCFNDVAWDFGYGKPFTEETEEMLLKALEPDFVDGLSLLGGEPFEPENQRALLPFLKKVRERFPKKNIWCYTGYLFDKELLGDRELRGCRGCRPPPSGRRRRCPRGRRVCSGALQRGTGIPRFGEPEDHRCEKVSGNRGDRLA